MQKVVSNSSPIIHLAKIGKLELLKDYFQAITIPDAVYKECVIEGLEREEIGSDLILLDDYDAREKARLYGLKITGVIGILLRAKLEGKIGSLKEYLLGLKESGFWISNKLEMRLLMEVDESI